MQMRTHDMHGKLVSDAEELFYKILDETRLKGSSQEVMLITGSGKIQKRLIQLATEQDLYSYIPMANRGCIVIEFE